MDMRKLEELKEKLMRELDVTSGKTQMSIADIQMIDTLTHSIKNICKILEESGHSGGDWRAEGSYSDRGYSRDYSGARHYVRGHYSRDAYDSNRSYRDMLESEYSNTRDERERDVIKHMLDRLERM
nr:MAG TPA: hypothetical protein [Caudoviricetes sp.]